MLSNSCLDHFLMCTRISSIYRKHSTARRNPPCTKKQHIKYVPSRARQRKQAESWQGLACRRAFIQLAAFSKRTKKSKSARQNIQYNHPQSSWSWCRARRTRLYFQSQEATTLTLLSLSVLCMYFVHACGVRVVFLEHGALRICKSSVCT